MSSKESICGGSNPVQLTRMRVRTYLWGFSDSTWYLATWYVCHIVVWFTNCSTTICVKNPQSYLDHTSTVTTFVSLYWTYRICFKRCVSYLLVLIDTTLIFQIYNLYVLFSAKNCLEMKIKRQSCYLFFRFRFCCILGVIASFPL